MSLASSISDRMNPIVVKELRQAVQGRFTGGVLVLVLSLEMLALLIHFLTRGPRVSEAFDAGPTVFVIVHSILLAVCLLFLPGYSAVRLARERSEAGTDLLFVTTLRPRSVIAGKLLAALTLCFLLYTASLPFMALTYFLRGIDLPSIFAVAALGFLVVAAAVQLAILFAALPVSRAAQLLLGALMVQLLLMTYGLMVAFSSSIITSSVGMRLGSRSFWPASLVGLLPLFALGAIVFALSAALITPAAANRALPVRLLVTGLWAATGVAAVAAEALGAAAVSASGFPFPPAASSPLRLWASTSLFVLSAAIFGAVGERERWGPRVARTIPRPPGLRLLAFLSYSGAAGGVVWASLLAAATVATVATCRVFGPPRQWIVPLAGLALYCFDYALTAVVLRRWLFAPRIPASRNGVVALLLLAGASTLPTIVGSIFFYETWRPDEDWVWSFGNPFALWRTALEAGLIRFAAVWAALIAAPAAPWFFEQYRSFRPLEAPREAATEVRCESRSAAT